MQKAAICHAKKLAGCWHVHALWLLVRFITVLQVCSRRFFFRFLLSNQYFFFKKPSAMLADLYNIILDNIWILSIRVEVIRWLKLKHLYIQTHRLSDWSGLCGVGADPNCSINIVWKVKNNRSSCCFDSTVTEFQFISIWTLCKRRSAFDNSNTIYPTGLSTGGLVK